MKTEEEKAEVIRPASFQIAVLLSACCQNEQRSDKRRKNKNCVKTELKFK